MKDKDYVRKLECDLRKRGKQIHELKKENKRITKLLSKEVLSRKTLKLEYDRLSETQKVRINRAYKDVSRYREKFDGLQDRISASFWYGVLTSLFGVFCVLVLIAILYGVFK